MISVLTTLCALLIESAARAENVTRLGPAILSCVMLLMALMRRTWPVLVRVGYRFTAFLILMRLVRLTSIMLWFRWVRWVILTRIPAISG